MQKLPPNPIAQQVLDLLPDPVLLLRQGAAGAEIVWGNSAARTLFRLGDRDVRLELALRQPPILEAIERARAERAAVETIYDSIGVQPRYWRAFAQPLESLGESSPDMLLVIRDETDARRTERMRADFLANASHELRTPLAALAGFVETLRTHARDDPDAQAQFLNIMADQASRMTRLIDDLLSLSRIELNEHIAPEGRADLARITREVIEGSRPLLVQSDVKVELAGEAPPVLGDADQLSQVVQNLLDNAVRHSPHGAAVCLRLAPAPELPASPLPISIPEGVAISLLAPDHLAPSGYARLEVIDQGAGIARQHLPRLSERFYRVDGQSRRGTGLGLAIVKHVVNRHRGALTVESAESRGSRFAVYLPAAPVPDAEIERAPAR